MTRFNALTTLFTACALLMGCQGESTTIGTTTAVQSKVLSQLSAGGGIAGFDFYMDIVGVSTRVGSLLVTNGAFDEGYGYYDEQEYWRWDAAALAEIETGAVDQIDVVVFGSSETYDATIVGNFESGTEAWTPWQVNREFTLHKGNSVVWNDPGEGEVLYELEAAGWGEETETITYYHLMDFSEGLGYPEMTWYIAGDDYHRWARSESTDEDSGSIWEVRLTDDTVFEQTSVGVGYELETVK